MPGRATKGIAATRERLPSPRVRELLRAILRVGSLRQASYELGMTPANAHRLLRSVERRLDLRLTSGARGGQGGGGTRLTRAGRQLALSRGGLVAARVTWWPCRLVEAPRRDSSLLVSVPGADVTASVAPIRPSQRPTRGLRPGMELELGIVPEAVTVLPAGTRIHGSARNFWRAVVVRIRRPTRFGVQILHLDVKERTLVVTVTASAVKELRLKAGSNVVVQLKATALRLRIPVR